MENKIKEFVKDKSIKELIIGFGMIIIILGALTYFGLFALSDNNGVINNAEFLLFGVFLLESIIGVCFLFLGSKLNYWKEKEQEESYY